MINFWQYKKKASFNQKTFLIVGLGNNGFKFLNTRHNIGMQAVNEIASTLRISLEYELFNCYFYKGKCGGVNFILAKSKGLMNNSGHFVNDLAKHFKIEINNILVIYDCYSVKSGVIKLKVGTTGGHHNGVKSVVQSLNSTQFNCLMIGICGAKRESETLEHYVLGKQTTAEKITNLAVLELMPDIFYDFLNTEMSVMIEKYNKLIIEKKQNS